MRDALLQLLVVSLPPIAILSLMGVAPVLGPLRATTLGLLSRAAAVPPLVGRGAELSQLRAALGGASGAPLVVTGPRGVGKTLLLDTALQGGSGGVAVLALPPSAGEHDTRWAACKAVTKDRFCGIEEGSARRVLWWHRWLFGAPFTLVLRPAASSQEDAAAARRHHATLLSAATALASTPNLRVVVDATDFRPEPPAYHASHATPSVHGGWLVVQPLPRAALEALPGLAALLRALRAEGAAEATWEALGGEPAAYEQLDAQWRAGGQGVPVAALAAAFAQERVAVAMDRVSLVLGKHARAGRLLRDCGSGQAVPFSRLGELGLLSEELDGVLRAVVVPGAAPGSLPQRLLLPADAATAMVLSKGLVVKGCEAVGVTVRVAGW